MSLRKSSSNGGLRVSVEARALTEMRTLDSVLPPSPRAVRVYVVDADGVTDVEPCGVTAPTSGAIETLAASVVFQDNFTDSPLLTDTRSAVSEAVGFDAAGGGVGGTVAATGFLWQPTTAGARTAEEISETRTRTRCE